MDDSKNNFMDNQKPNSRNNSRDETNNRSENSALFTTRIKELRARYNLTQEALAKKTDVRRETINHIEKGRYNPSLLLAYNIAKALNSSIEEIFIFRDSSKNQP